jgi:hypothetical protein
MIGAAQGGVVDPVGVAHTDPQPGHAVLDVDDVVDAAQPCEQLRCDLS